MFRFHSLFFIFVYHHTCAVLSSPVIHVQCRLYMLLKGLSVNPKNASHRAKLAQKLIQTFTSLFCLISCFIFDSKLEIRFCQSLFLKFVVILRFLSVNIEFEELNFLIYLGMVYWVWIGLLTYASTNTDYFLHAQLSSYPKCPWLWFFLLKNAFVNLGSFNLVTACC